MLLNRLTANIFSIMRKEQRFWSAKELSAIFEDTETADIEKLLNHHSDMTRFAKVPACEQCNPILNKSMTCRHPGRFYVYLLLHKGMQLLVKHEKPAEKSEPE